MTEHNKYFSSILGFIEKKRVVTSGEIAKYLGISWNTADSWLKELLIEGKIIRIKKPGKSKGGLNLWLKK